MVGGMRSVRVWVSQGVRSVEEGWEEISESGIREGVV